ncbi:MAG: hypothetical protein KDK70_41790 [Myxococcales bacterium]|nr:hypothetical protein [Myxococcales bacterium]
MTDSHDFDFLHGAWRVRHRRLRERLVGCEEWEEFDGTSTCWPTLEGHGNVDDNRIDLPQGAYSALTMRSFDAADEVWSIWWLDARAPRHLDPPLVGSFVDGVGTFRCDDTWDGRPIVVRFLWSTGPEAPRWEQAFSADGGQSWETNWVMDFERVAG